MTPQDRDKQTTYRITKVPDSSLAYQVSMYPDTGAEHITSAMYREDTIPQWMLEAVRTLDVSGQISHNIPFYGEKKGDAYWLYSEETYRNASELGITVSWYIAINFEMTLNAQE